MQKNADRVDLENMLKNASLLAVVAVHTAENESQQVFSFSLKIWGKKYERIYHLRPSDLVLVVQRLREQQSEPAKIFSTYCVHISMHVLVKALKSEFGEHQPSF